VSRLKLLSYASILFIFSAPVMVWAQPPSAGSDQQAEGHAQPKGEGAICLRNAGVTPPQMQQMIRIHQQADQKLLSACQDASLSADQKRQRVLEAQAEEQKQIMALFTPQEQEAVKQCRPEWRQSAAARRTRGGQRDMCAAVLERDSKKHSQQARPAPQR
jgi:hypothetical protein